MQNIFKSFKYGDSVFIGIVRFTNILTGDIHSYALSANHMTKKDREFMIKLGKAALTADSPKEARDYLDKHDTSFVEFKRPGTRRIHR